MKSQTVEPQDPATRLQAQHGGARILLVEDNAINREVALKLLRDANLCVAAVENGADAVAIVQAKHYDLVLMDVQMPIMNGTEATRLIRSMPGPMASDRNMAILAMTANTSAADRQACLDAGMNDFVDKPVQPENLFSVITRWLPPHTSCDLAQGTRPAAAHQETRGKSTVLNQLERLPGIDTGLGLRNVLGDVHSYLWLLREFDTTSAGEMHQLMRALADRNFRAAGNVVHTLKGAAGTLGLTGVLSAAAALETSLRHIGPGRVMPEQCVPDLEIELRQLHDVLTNHKNQ